MPSWKQQPLQCLFECVYLCVCVSLCVRVFVFVFLSLCVRDVHAMFFVFLFEPTQFSLFCALLQFLTCGLRLANRDLGGIDGLTGSIPDPLPVGLTYL